MMIPDRRVKTGLNPAQVRLKHCLSRILLMCRLFDLDGCTEFSGTILGSDFGGSTPVLF